jgi:hypothetical protein
MGSLSGALSIYHWAVEFSPDTSLNRFLFYFDMVGSLAFQLAPTDILDLALKIKAVVDEVRDAEYVHRLVLNY